MANAPTLQPVDLKRANLRPAGFDDLGLRRALGDRMLPALVGAMAFLAALALAGAVGAASLARHWQQGAAAALTIQVPNPAGRLDKVMALLQSTSGIASARALTEEELSTLLRPWLGSAATQLSLPLPAVIETHLSDPSPDLTALAAKLEAIAPGTMVESHGRWVQRLSTLARSLQACAWAALAIVVGVAAAVIAIATRAGLTARREAIEIVHGLGATDSYIAGRFARRATRLAAIGGTLGAIAALPMLLVLADLAAPFAAPVVTPLPSSDLLYGNTPIAIVFGWLRALPPTLWLVLPGLPAGAALIGFLTAQGTVRRWLRRLP